MSEALLQELTPITRIAAKNITARAIVFLIIVLLEVEFVAKYIS
jgi:hypothetical protein